jgi:hypothetical protein
MRLYQTDMPDQLRSNGSTLVDDLPSSSLWTMVIFIPRFSFLTIIKSWWLCTTMVYMSV